jgi:hypothetical protein
MERGAAAGATQKLPHPWQPSWQLFVGRFAQFVKRTETLDDASTLRTYRVSVGSLIVEIFGLLSEEREREAVDRILDLQIRLLDAPAIERAARFGQGHRRDEVPWHAVVRQIMTENPEAAFSAIWHRMKRDAGPGQPIEAVIMAGRLHACEDLNGRRCRDGYHIHYHDTETGSRSVTLNVIRNFVSQERQPRRP